LEDSSVTVRRIERLEAEQRGVARRGGNTSELDEQIAYWKDRLVQASKRPFGPGDFKPGDQLGKWGMGGVVLKVGDKSITIALRRTDLMSSPPRTDTFLYTKMGSTSKPEAASWEPEEKGKHPRAALIDAIYKHPLTPDAWKVRIGWKHGIVYEPEGFGKGVALLILEDLTDGALNQLANEREIPVVGKIQKAEKHSLAPLIKAIYTARGAGYRSKEGGKNYIQVGGGRSICLEDTEPEMLARIAFRLCVDPVPFGVSTNWPIATQIGEWANNYDREKRTDIDGEQISVQEAKTVNEMLQTPEATEWVNTHPIRDSIRLAEIHKDYGSMPPGISYKKAERWAWALNRFEEQV
jgi:hypothetical protein